MSDFDNDDFLEGFVEGFLWFFDPTCWRGWLVWAVVAAWAAWYFN